MVQVARDYLVIRQRARTETVVKRSRFIATASPVKDEAEAQQFVDEIRREFWDATHNVYAFTVGDNDEIVRSSDDGEPSGTAGRPVLEVILKEGIKHCAVVVTRYFGGTLLGAGGLVRHMAPPPGRRYMQPESPGWCLRTRSASSWTTRRWARSRATWPPGILCSGRRLLGDCDHPGVGARAGA